METTSFHLMWVPAYLSLGTLAYMADSRWGVPIMRTIRKPFAEDGEEIHGFIVGRPRRTKLVVGVCLSYFITILMILHGNTSWYFEMAYGFFEGFVCWIGMELGPLAAVGMKVLGFTLDRVDALESGLKQGVPTLVEQARAKGQELNTAARAAIEAHSQPALSAEEESRAKIAKMDALLGRKESGPSDQPPAE